MGFVLFIIVFKGTKTIVVVLCLFQQLKYTEDLAGNKIACPFLG